ncbi:MAG: hypothetical protein WDO15_02970 [Bacteroidota bacterium]
MARQYEPEYPFNYTFLDDDFEKLYNTEKVTGSLAFGFTVIAIIISGLGLLALAAYTAEKKTEGDQHSQDIRCKCWINRWIDEQ